MAKRPTPSRIGRKHGAPSSPALVELGHILGAAGTANVLSMGAPDDSASWTTEGCAPGTRRNILTGQVWPIPDAE